MPSVCTLAVQSPKRLTSRYIVSHVISFYFGCPITKATYFQVRVRVQCAQLPPRLPARRVRRRRLRHSPLHHRKAQVGQVSSSAVFGLKLHKSRPFGERLVTLSDQKQVALLVCALPTLYKKLKFYQNRLSAVLLLFLDWAHSHLIVPSATEPLQARLKSKTTVYGIILFQVLSLNSLHQHAGPRLRGCPAR